MKPTPPQVNRRPHYIAVPYVVPETGERQAGMWLVKEVRLDSLDREFIPICKVNRFDGILHEELMKRGIPKDRVADLVHTITH